MRTWSTCWLYIGMLSEFKIVEIGQHCLVRHLRFWFYFYHLQIVAPQLCYPGTQFEMSDISSGKATFSNEPNGRAESWGCRRWRSRRRPGDWWVPMLAGKYQERESIVLDFLDSCCSIEARGPRKEDHHTLGEVSHQVPSALCARGCQSSARHANCRPVSNMVVERAWAAIANFIVRRSRQQYSPRGRWYFMLLSRTMFGRAWLSAAVRFSHHPECIGIEESAWGLRVASWPGWSWR